jgi:hypothetical protein
MVAVARIHSKLGMKWAVIGGASRRVCHTEDIIVVKRNGLSSHISAKFREKRVKTMKFTRLFNAFKRLRDIGTAKTEHKPIQNQPLHNPSAIKSPDLPPVTANAKPKRAVKFSQQFIQNQQMLDFDLTEALRLRSLGWGNRKIARQMNNCSRETVRKRLQEYDAAEALKAVPKPVVPPMAPPVTSSQLPPDKPETLPEPFVMPTASRQEPTPPEPVTLSVPEPVTNYADLTAMRKARYGDNFPTDLSRVFIVRPEHVKFGLGSEQPCVGFDGWRPEYRTLEIFQPPRQFYVLINAEDGAAINRAWLDGLASDVWLRERCSVVRIERGGVLSVLQSRYSAQRQYPAQAYGARLADEAFERWHKFQPMSQHGHHELLAALTKDAVPQPVPQVVSGGYGVGWTSHQPMPPQPTYDWTQGRSEAAGGLAGQDDGTNYGK